MPTRKKAKAAAVKKKAPPRPRYTRPRQAAAPINQHAPAGLERLVDVNTVAQHLLCSTRMVRKLQAEDPDFPRPIKLGTLTRWRVKDIEAFLIRLGPRGRHGRA